MAVPIIKVVENGLVVDNHPLSAPFFSLWNQWPHLRGRSLVIGFIGPRGSGKGTSAARVLGLDYLLKGRKVWSNMPVALDLALPNGQTYPLRSIERGPDFNLKDCYNGCLFSDEINEADADAYRSQSTDSLEFSYDIQELRKSDAGGLSKMDFIWTTQSELWIPPRLRFQTDIIIKCADLSLTKKVGIGEYSRWEIWDYSGIVTGQQTSVKLPPAPVIFTKPWWHAYQTGLKQRGRKIESSANEQAEIYAKAAEIASYVHDNEKVRTLKVWSMFGISERKEQQSIMRILGSDFDVFPDGRRDYLKIEKDLVEA